MFNKPYLFQENDLRINFEFQKMQHIFPYTARVNIKYIEVNVIIYIPPKKYNIRHKNTS